MIYVAEREGDSLLHVQRRRVFALVLPALMIVVLFAVGCSGGGASEPLTPADIEIHVVATEWAFEPAQIKVPAGKTVRITLENKGSVAHNFAVKDLAFQVDVAPKQTKGRNLTLKNAAEYRLICSLPGHAESGMVGTFTVTESGVSIQPLENSPIVADFSAVPGAITR
jgi:uncharacterized cupredoxin-like copper-binding protein